MEKLRAESPEKVDKCMAVAGLSLGEYSALTCAGVLSFADGLRLVKIRGEAMQEAAQTGAKQGMLSVTGLEESKLKELCDKARQGDEVCQIANFLFPKGFAVAGSTS